MQLDQRALYELAFMENVEVRALQLLKSILNNSKDIPSIAEYRNVASILEEYNFDLAAIN
jgi:hypothetical protein